MIPDSRPPTPDVQSPTPDRPRCAVLTPIGRGAVATIGVRGPGAATLVGRRFTAAAGKRLEAFPVGRVVFGRFRTSAATEEELVVGLVGPEEVEVHCHGGSAAVAAVQAALAAEGCIAVTAEQWARQQESDPLSAAALVALAHARTERTAAILLDQYRGALRTELVAIQRQLEQHSLGEALCQLQQLQHRAELGLHLTRPWQIVLAGRPNAGKSSLINAILGYERAIVFEQPGTTRDVLTATTALDGWPVELADTAGLCEAGNPLEAEGVLRARRQIDAADAVVLVADTTAAWDKDLFRVQSAANRRLTVVHNKCDLAPPPADRPRGAEVSAKTGQGIDELCHTLAACLVPNPPPRGAGVPFSYQQAAVLEKAAGELARGNAAAAQRALAAM